ncbi:hypothetical protein [Mariniphaga sediminis]|uniref:hypothetical protein n=1 Tax=Mariniphaga sediminis TaxID=1628158 RepID=UPI003564E01E
MEFKNLNVQKKNQDYRLWDAFEEFLSENYYPEAIQTLDKETIAFEFAEFKHCYSD